VRASALAECTLRIVFLANPYDNHRCCPPLCVLRLPTLQSRSTRVTPSHAAAPRRHTQCWQLVHTAGFIAHALFSELLTTTCNSVGSSRALACRSFKLFSCQCFTPSDSTVPSEP